MTAETEEVFLALFPFLFGGMWLLVTTILGFMSGWFNLQQWYDQPSEEPILILRWQSGSMGLGVSLSNILKLGAYRRGLGIGIWRIFGPFQRPFLVPWAEIEAQHKKSIFISMVKLNLGNVGTLSITARSWARLMEAAGPAIASRFPANQAN